jgi:hypothetical protein
MIPAYFTLLLFFQKNKLGLEHEKVQITLL